MRRRQVTASTIRHRRSTRAFVAAAWVAMGLAWQLFEPYLLRLTGFTASEAEAVRTERDRIATLLVRHTQEPRPG